MAAEEEDDDGKDEGGGGDCEAEGPADVGLDVDDEGECYDQGYGEEEVPPV